MFQVLVIVLIVLVLFGRGRISEAMGDFGKGVKGFRSGLTDDDQAAGTDGPILESEVAAPVQQVPDQSHN